MPNFHPDTALLVDYASGSVHRAQAICLSTHLSFCAQCAQQVRHLEELGGDLALTEPAALSSGLLDKTLATLDSAEPPTPRPTAQARQIEGRTDLLNGQSALPELVQKLITGIPAPAAWRKLSNSVSMARLPTGQKDYEVALQRICAGGKTPHHGHTGDEFTVVLQGSFSDEDGVYSAGDFLYRGPGEVHQPLGALHEDCICLTAVSARIKLRSRFDWLFAPLLRIKPM